MENAIDVLRQDIDRADRAIDRLRGSFIDELTMKQYNKWVKANQLAKRQFGCDWLHSIDINKISKSQSTQAYFYNWIEAVKRWNILDKRNNFYIVEVA